MDFLSEWFNVVAAAAAFPFYALVLLALTLAVWGAIRRWLWAFAFGSKEQTDDPQ